MEFSLGVSEVQVLVNFPQDTDGFYWHHRLLLHRVARGVWLCLSPDHEIVRHDLGAILHRIIERRSPFPADIADAIYAHGDMDDSEAYEWVISEPQHPKFGVGADVGLINNGATGLAFFDQRGHH